MRGDPTTPEHANSLNDLSGLEFLRAVIAGDSPRAPMEATLGYELVEVAEGRAVFSATPRREVFKPLGSVHGGWFGTILDSRMGCAVHAALPPGRIYTTLEYKVNTLRAATQDTGPLRAVGEATHVGRRTAAAVGRMTDEAGKLCAIGATTCITPER